ncbi:MAG: gliding motility-associated C-terminal domain-containing protein [Crocinitomicaceae bacterium]|nr:gliding motility-associated C-terminal domain-containing protein [Crocinitomicaceae bacterium]
MYITKKTFTETLLVFICMTITWCSFAQCPNDFDCDGINDLNDFDDDNDGITDIEELSNCIDFSNMSTSGQLIFDEDFGSGPNWGPGLPPGTTSYCHQDGPGPVNCLQPQWAQGTYLVTDGQYTILNNPNVGFPDAFRVQDDHTPNDVDGYQLVINASFVAGEMYRQNNISIPSSNFQAQVVVFSAWISNIGSEQNQTYCANNPPLINPNVDFVLEDDQGIPIGTPISTGVLPFVNDGANAWFLYTAAFQVTGTSSVNIAIKNNASGGCGNDLAIDDITLYYADVNCDFDQDGISDYLDLDSDNDGIFDVIEGGDGSSDTNGDGVIDANDIGFSDADGNGVDDSSELTSPVHSDNDGLPDYLDLDSDDDGCFDAVEAGYLDNDNDGILGSSPVAVNAFGVIQNQSGYNGTLPAVTIAGGQIAPDFNYPQLIFCITENAVLPTITGSNNGAFSVSINGLSLDPITGEIDPSASNLGVYQVTYTPDEICLSDTTLVVTIVDLPTVDPVADIILCEGSMLDTIQFSGSATNYNWTNSNTIIGLTGSGIGNIPSFVSSLNGSQQTALIEVTPAVGLCVGSPETFSITLNPTDTTTIGYPQLSACQSESEILASISGAYGGVFSSTPTGLDVESSTGVITPNNSLQGDYIITYESGANCPNQSNAPFEISIAPNIIGMSDISVCDGEEIVFPLISTGNQTDNIQWQILPNDNLGIGNSGIGGSINSVTGVNTSSSPVSSIIAAFATSDLGCVGPIETFNVTVHPIPEVEFSGDVLSGCEPHEVQFTGVSNIAGVDCLWDFGNGTTSNQCNQTSVTYMAGEYDVSLTVTTDAGCSNTEIFEDYINVYPTPTASFSFTPGQLDILNTEVQFYNSSLNASNYLWSFGDSSATNTNFSPSHIYPNAPGVSYIVTLWAFDDNFQCFDSVQQVITVDDVLIYYVPNTFTPDNVEFNQTFQPVFTAGFDPYDFQIIIFDRWGELIFESFNADEGWDGTYNGKLVPDGTYTWKIEFKTSSSDERVAVIGHLNLIR